jgi:hypothetical protein
MLEDVVSGQTSKEISDLIAYNGPTSIIEKSLKELIHEIWSSVIPT